MAWIRRLRAAAIIALIWAVLGLPFGAALGVLINRRPHFEVAPPSTLWFTIAISLWGACSGAVFALLLRIAERGKSVATLSAARVAVWGALGCVTPPIGITIYDLASVPTSFHSYDWFPALCAVAITGGLGAVGAVTTLRLGRPQSITGSQAA